MALQVNLTLSKTYFLPGELVQVCVQISNGAFDSTDAQQLQLVPPVVTVKELSFQACGTERTDTNVMRRFFHQEVPGQLVDSRKCIRSIFSTESAVLVSDKVLAPNTVQSFRLKFRLPSVLPPSYRGTAVRFLYNIQVKAIYEVNQGDLDAVVYETTASTSLVIWPGLGSGNALPGITGTDRRSCAYDSHGGSGGNGPMHVTSGALEDSLGNFDSLGGTEGSFMQKSGLGPSTGITPVNSMQANLVPSGHPSGHDDGDVPMCDYMLGRSCRIRWQAMECGDVGGVGTQAFTSRASDALSGGNGASSAVMRRGAASSAAPLRGVIPFGINRPFSPPHPMHNPCAAANLETDSDGDEQERSIAGSSTGNAPSTATKLSSQRQMSTGGLSAFGRPPCRRGSLFGKVYALNIGEQPLLRLLLHAPLEVPLQPGATFGGVLDFRQPQFKNGTLVPWPAPASIACYDVAILLESEEVISPECRPPQTDRVAKRDSNGLSSSAPYVIRQLHAEHHEVTHNGALTAFTLSLPSTATPSFRTPMVSLRWVLRFELTVGQRTSFTTSDKHARPAHPLLEQLVWSLPLVVRPPASR